ncbi:MAG: hypothetical protein KGZ63_09305 [Clostridiales bacterium]|nr:hypothetical protein [Clostridiales bacterium]
MLRKTICFILLCLLLVGCSAGKEVMPEIVYQGHYDYYNSTNELIETADIIVLGRVESQNVEIINIGVGDQRDESAEFVYTVSNISVQKVLKGNFKEEETIRVKQLGGTLNGQVYREEGTEFFKKNRPYLFFLADFQSEYNTPFEVLNPTQGHLEFANDEAVFTADSPFKGKGLENQQAIFEHISSIVNNKE